MPDFLHAILILVFVEGAPWTYLGISAACLEGAFHLKLAQWERDHAE